MRNYFFMIVLCVLSACGGGGGTGGSHSAVEDGKNLAITVTGSRSFNPDVEPGKIVYYQMTLSAEDISDPIVKKFDGDADEAQILNVPVGTSRTILVEAYNPNGLVIRRGKKEGVSIEPNALTSVSIAMSAVPIFTNITDKSAISGNRLGFEVFAEPSSQVEVLNLTAGDETPVIDASRNSAYLDTSVNQTGLYSINPQTFDYGTYSFEVKDLQSGESSQVSLTLYRRTFRPGLSINSGGQAVVSGEDLVLSSVGQPGYRDPDASVESLGGTLLDVVEGFY